MTAGSHLERAVRRAIFRGYYQLTGRKQILDGIERLETLYRSSRATIDSVARKRLAHILNHSARTVPYYSDLIGDRHISEKSAQSILSDMPILTKDILREQGERLLSSEPGTRPRWTGSSGSTAEPVMLLQDQRMLRESRTGELLFMRWAGQRLGDPHVLVWLVSHDLLGKRVSLRERVFSWACNETYLHCARITDDLLDSWIVELNRLRPTLIEAYVDVLHELSRRALMTGAEVPRPRGIIVSAGPLTTAAREAIGKAFRAPILDRYGSREVGNVACSCGDSDELHVHEAWSHVEIVDDLGRPCPPEVEGNILVTLHSNHTMPLIRYRIEDRGLWAPTRPCMCGRTTKRFAAVRGRMNDFLIAADGTKISGYPFLAALVEAEGVRRFQLRQSEDGSVTFLIVPLPGWTPDSLETALAGPLRTMRDSLGDRSLEMKIVDEIAPTRSGKYRGIICQMKVPVPSGAG